MTEKFFEAYVEQHPGQFPKKDVSDRTRHATDVSFKGFVESLTFENTTTEPPGEGNQEV